MGEVLGSSSAAVSYQHDQTCFIYIYAYIDISKDDIYPHHNFPFGCIYLLSFCSAITCSNFLRTFSLSVHFKHKNVVHAQTVKINISGVGQMMARKKIVCQKIFAKIKQWIEPALQSCNVS
jgi:hypothetical protein